MQTCVQCVPFQLPNKFTRVGYLLDTIENDDPQFQAAIVRVHDDVVPPIPPSTQATGKRNDFEESAAYLLPKCPVTRRHAIQGDKRSLAEISLAETQVNKVPKFGKGGLKVPKKGIGTTGVNPRYRTPCVVDKNTNHGKNSSIAAAVAKAVSEAMGAKEEEEET